MKIKIFGTKIYVSFLFSATLSLMLATDRTGLMIPTLFAVLIHEAGHLFAMWASDCSPKEIRLIPASVQIVESISGAPAGIGVVLCGPLANLAVAAALFINFYLSGFDISLRFGMLNGVLAVFNMLPVTGLDGGRLIEHIIARKKDLYTAEKTVRIITLIVSAAAFILGVWLALSRNVNISVFIVALYLAVCGMMKR